MPRTFEQRLTTLERDAYQAAAVQRETDAHLAHLTSAAGELSQAARGHTHQLGEIDRALADHTVRFERVEAVLREHTARLERIEQAMVQQAGLLRTIVDRLGGQAPAAAEG